MSNHKNIIFDLQGVIFAAQITSSQTKQFVVIEEGFQLLQKIAAQKKYKLFICSNASDTSMQALQREFAHVLSLFHGSVHSAMIQVKKPDARIFQHLLDSYALIPHECIFLDDAQENVIAAEQLGMTGVHVADFQEVETELKKLGVLKSIS
jgi:FMN phosphatase YigB (HAD superfamily)